MAKGKVIDEEAFAEIKQMTSLKDKDGNRVLSNSRVAQATGYAQSTINRIARFDSVEEYKNYIKTTIGFKKKKAVEEQADTTLIPTKELESLLRQNTELLTAIRSILIEGLTELKNNDQKLLEEIEKLGSKSPKRFSFINRRED